MRAMTHRARFMARPLVLSLAFALGATSSPALFGANHPNSRVASTHVLDLTANVDWDYDAASPTQAGSGGITLTQDVVRNQILREVARSVFLMTEGRHRIGTVYVYKNGRFGKNVDVQIINKSDRSYATPATWQQPEGSSFNFLAIDGKAENLRNYSRVIAHELGHYVYGFADEYREDGKALNAASPGSPSGVDYTRNSIMNNHEVFTRLSLAADYQGDATSNNTAQARVYASDRTTLKGGSQWEMLTRDPANDPATGKEFHGGNRVWFDAFKGFTPPGTLTDLTRYPGVYCDPTQVQAYCGQGDTSKDQVVPVADRLSDVNVFNSQLFVKSGGTATADAVDGAAGSAFESFNVVFVDSPGAAAKSTLSSIAPKRLAVTARASNTSAVPRHAIVLDRTLPAAVFEEARQAAIALVELSDPSASWGVYVSPPVNGSASLAPMTSIATGQAALVSALQGLSRVDGNFDSTAAMAQAQADLSNGRQLIDSASVDLFTAQGSTLPASLGVAARQARVSINSIGLMLPSGSSASKVQGGVTLDALAKASGGNAYSAKDAEQVVKKILRAERKASGEVFSLIESTGWDAFSTGSVSTPIQITSHDAVVSAHWSFNPADQGKLSFKLVTPAGTFTSLSAASNLADGYALIEVDNSDGRHNGAAQVGTVAAAAVNNPVGVDIQAESVVQLDAETEGGTQADPRKPVLRVQFSGQAPVARAQVLATFYRTSDGAAVLSDLPLADDGLGVDARADDGRYAADLSNLLPAGDYTVAVRAQTNASSFFQPNQIFAIGSTVPVVLTGAGLTRIDETDLHLDSGISGVAAGSSGSGGGCTVIDGQRDGGLVALILSALLGLYLRRSRRRAQPD